MFPSSLRDEGAAPPRAGFLLFPFWGSSPRPSRDVSLQVRLPAQRSAARHLWPATCAHLPRTPQDPGWAPAGRPRGLGVCANFFFLNKKPQRLPAPSSPARATFPSRPRHTSRAHALRGASPARQWVRGRPARQPTPSPRPHPGTPRRLSAGGSEEGREEAGEATMGEVGASPLGQEARSRRREKGRGRGSAAPPGRGPGALLPAAAAHSPARWQIAPPVHLARASAASKARCAP